MLCHICRDVVEPWILFLDSVISAMTQVEMYYDKQSYMVGWKCIMANSLISLCGNVLWQTVLYGCMEMYYGKQSYMVVWKCIMANSHMVGIWAYMYCAHIMCYRMLKDQQVQINFSCTLCPIAHQKMTCYITYIYYAIPSFPFCMQHF